jgi:signal transduction histidine kinase
MLCCTSKSPVIKMKSIRKVKILCIFTPFFLYALSLTSASRLQSQERERYEYRLSNLRYLRSTHIVVCGGDPGGALFFEFKPRLYGVAASNVASVWRGAPSAAQYVRRSTLDGASVYAAGALTDSSAAILFELADTLYIGEVDASLRIVDALPLPLSGAMGTPTHAAALAFVAGEAQSASTAVKILPLAGGDAILVSLGRYLIWCRWKTYKQTVRSLGATPKERRLAYQTALARYSLLQSASYSTSHSTSAALEVLRLDSLFLPPRGGAALAAAPVSEKSSILSTNSSLSATGASFAATNASNSTTSAFALLSDERRAQDSLARVLQAVIRPLYGASVADVVALNSYTRQANEPACAVLREAGLRKEVLFLSADGEELFMQSLDVQDRVVLRRVSNYTLAACAQRGAATTTYVVKMNAEPLALNIAASPECMAFVEEKNRVSIFAIPNDDATAYLRWIAVRVPFGGEKITSETLFSFPETVIAPLSVSVVGDEFLCVFANALFVMNFAGEPSSAYRSGSIFRLLRMSPVASSVQKIGENDGAFYILRVGSDVVMFERKSVPFWWLQNAVRDLWFYLVGLCVFGVIAALLYVWRYQDRLLKTMFGARDADALFVLDAEGKLLSVNDAARELLNIAPEAPMRRLFRYYCVSEKKGATEESPAKQLNDFVVAAQQKEQIAQTTLYFPKTLPGDAEVTRMHDYVFSIYPIRARFGKAMRGMMLVGKDVTKELANERIRNWERLAHDIKSIVSAIKLARDGLHEWLARDEVLNRVQGAAKSLEKAKRINDNIHDLDEYLQGFGDILSQRQQVKERVNTATICRQALNVYDSKSARKIRLRAHLPQIEFSCYKIPLVRALRNAIINGAKACKGDSGEIRVSARLEKRTLVFQIEDNGEGMSEIELQNFLNEGYSTRKNEGGSGLGTVVMYWAVKELHGGEISAQSEKGKGTTITFRIPAPDAEELRLAPEIIERGDDEFASAE